MRTFLFGEVLAWYCCSSFGGCCLLVGDRASRRVSSRASLGPLTPFSVCLSLPLTHTLHMRYAIFRECKLLAVLRQLGPRARSCIAFLVVDRVRVGLKRCSCCQLFDIEGYCVLMRVRRCD